MRCHADYRLGYGLLLKAPVAREGKQGPVTFTRILYIPPFLLCNIFSQASALRCRGRRRSVSLVIASPLSLYPTLISTVMISRRRTAPSLVINSTNVFSTGGKSSSLSSGANKENISLSGSSRPKSSKRHHKAKAAIIGSAVNKSPRRPHLAAKRPRKRLSTSSSSTDDSSLDLDIGDTGPVGQSLSGVLFDEGRADYIESTEADARARELTESPLADISDSFLSVSGVTGNIQ
ncbi:hypothetical protein EW146_g4076 [Bondarzewia mesenterica]|uniref:Uncharacterized protein n=1 Tax=Bondarzewia mesenterica TaxID=1095465 RepID=A0A4V3XF88_9AGAM|nr:hypothetical protein EW146_g4076 [Bondarzewia mesenterica]